MHISGFNLYVRLVFSVIGLISCTASGLFHKIFLDNEYEGVVKNNLAKSPLQR